MRGERPLIRRSPGGSQMPEGFQVNGQELLYNMYSFIFVSVALLFVGGNLILHITVIFMLFVIL